MQLKQFRRVMLGMLCAVFAPTAMAVVSVAVVEQGARSTLLRITVEAPKLEGVDTPAGRFERFSQREIGQGGTLGGVDNRGFPELPVIGFPLAMPVDLKDAPAVQVTPEGSIHRLQTRVFPVQPPDTAQ